MSVFTLVLEIAFEDLPLLEAAAGPPEIPAWFDVSADVRGEISVTRGRASEFDQVDAGVMTFTLKNSNRVYDPDNSAGVYYPNIVPGRKVRLRAQVDAVFYPRFTGFIRSWNVEYLGGTESYATVTCVDAFKYFNLLQFSMTATADFTGDRILSIFDLATATTLARVWPISDRDIAMGNITVPPDTFQHENVLAHIQRCAAAERGLFFIAGNGDATLQDSTHRDSPVSEATFSNAVPPDADDLPYTKLITTFDDSLIWNEVQITRQGGIVQTAVDLTSQDNYFTRTFEQKNQLYEDDTAALDAGKLVLVRYKEPQVRAKTLIVDPAALGGAASLEDAYAEVLERELSDMITIKRTTLVDGVETTYEAFIERIQDTITLQQWIVAFTLSPVITAVDSSTDTLNETDDWRVPVLENGWANSGSASNPPAGYRREGDWVSLRGYVLGGSTGDTILTLPVGCRPPYVHRCVVLANADPGYARVETDGTVSLTTGDPTSLDLSAISFRVI